MNGDRREFFEELIFRSMGSHRFTQDSPILPDVWLAYGLEPLERQDLLITPDVEATPHGLARRLRSQLEIEGRGDAAASLPAAAKPIQQALHKLRQSVWGPANPAVAHHQTAAVAELWFYELIRVVLPLSEWWQKKMVRGDWARLEKVFNKHQDQFKELLIEALEAHENRDRRYAIADGQVVEWQPAGDGARDEEAILLSAQLVWLVRLAGTIALLAESWRRLESDKLEWWLFRHDRALWRRYRAGDEEVTAGKPPAGYREEKFDASTLGAGDLRDLTADPGEVVTALFKLLNFMKPHLPTEEDTGLVLQVNRNRPGAVSIYESGNAVKADAVRQLFSVRGQKIRWAVVDSGIDASHLAFRRRGEDGRPLGRFVEEEVGGRKSWQERSLELRAGAVQPPASRDGWAHDGAFVRHPLSGRWRNYTRVRASYDFTKLRYLLSAGSYDEIPEAMRQRAERSVPKEEWATFQADLKRALQFSGRIDWGLLEPLLKIPHDDGYTPPVHHHGTHVAGIIGADWRVDEHRLTPRQPRLGIAPEIELYDLRVLDDSGRGNEFSIMGALQFVRYLNTHRTTADQVEIHGVNLSFSIKHDVSNYACGRTPVCDEAERLVGAGVVVVAAAGNQGRARYRTATGQEDEGYRSISITDPGNADGVITVGATHRNEPHTYGVSYFSSRGPTGDGRRKPDLVAPGERIYSTVPMQGELDLDGTSMAAPHASGAAALLMERHFELIGQPRRVKQILCASATDLGREAYFQGAGMLDVLRALQSV